MSQKENLPTNPNRNAFPDEFQSGLTKREYFAAMAVQGYLANAHIRIGIETSEIVNLSVTTANLLIAELNK